VHFSEKCPKKGNNPSGKNSPNLVTLHGQEALERFHNNENHSFPTTGIQTYLSVSQFLTTITLLRNVFKK
jgi:hypothetical protein